MRLFRRRATLLVNAALIVALIGSAVVAGNLVGSDGDEVDTAPTATVRRGTVLSTVSAAGSVVSSTEVGLDFSASGQLASLQVEVGDPVEAGDELALLDGDEAQLQVESAEAQLAAAEADLAELLAGQTPAEARISHAQTAQAVEQLQAARTDLDNARQLARTNAGVYDDQLSHEREQIREAEGDLALSVDNARAAVRQAQANLDLLLQGLTPAQEQVHREQLEQATLEIENATAALVAARDVAEANAAAYDQQLDAARSRAGRADDDIEDARDDLTDAQADLDDAEDDLEDAGDDVDDADDEVAEAEDDVARFCDQTVPVPDPTATDTEATPADDADDPVNPAACSAAQAALQQARSALQLTQSAEQRAEAVRDQADAAVDQAEQTLDAARNAAAEARDQIEAAEVARRQGLAQDRRATDQAATALAQAQAAHDVALARAESDAEPPTDSQIAQAEAQVEQAQTQLAQAMRAEPDESRALSADIQRRQGRVADEQGIERAASAVEQARASVDVAAAQENLAAQDATDPQISRAVSQVSQARVALEQARENADDTVLRAPVGGTVAAINAEAGELVTPGGSGVAAATGGADATSGLIVITDVEALLVEAEFAEADTTQITVGQPATVTLNARPDEQIAARVALVEPVATVDGDLIRYGVWLTLEGGRPDLRPDQTTIVEVVTGQSRDTLYVPTSAVATTGDEATVTVLEDGEQVVRSVATGIEGDGTTEILSGVEEGDVVVLGVGVAAPTTEAFDPETGPRPPPRGDEAGQ